MNLITVLNLIFVTATLNNFPPAFRHYIFFVFWFGIRTASVPSTPKRAQVEGQYWGNPKVARLEGTPAILI